jgi:hypothetical protein
MGWPRWVRVYPALAVLAALFLATPARAAVIIPGELDDLSYRASLAVSTNRVTSLLGAMSTGDPGTRGVLYIFKLPTSDTGQNTIRSADFRFTVASALTKPTYGIDLYALPARLTTTTLETDYFFGPLDTTTPPTGAVTRIVDNLALPDAVPSPTQVAVPFASGSSFVDFLNAQYGADGSGAGKYILLRLNPDVLLTTAPEDTGWNVNMAEALTGKPSLTVTFVPEPALTLPAGLLLLAALRRRPRPYIRAH